MLLVKPSYAVKAAIFRFKIPDDLYDAVQNLVFSEDGTKMAITITQGTASYNSSTGIWTMPTPPRIRVYDITGTVPVEISTITGYTSNLGSPIGYNPVLSYDGSRLAAGNSQASAAVFDTSNLSTEISASAYNQYASLSRSGNVSTMVSKTGTSGNETYTYRVYRRIAGVQTLVYTYSPTLNTRPGTRAISVSDEYLVYTEDNFQADSFVVKVRQWNGSTYVLKASYNAGSYSYPMVPYFINNTGTLLYANLGSTAIYKYRWNGSTYVQEAFPTFVGLPAGTFPGASGIAYKITAESNGTYSVSSYTTTNGINFSLNEKINFPINSLEATIGQIVITDRIVAQFRTPSGGGYKDYITMFRWDNYSPFEYV